MSHTHLNLNRNKRSVVIDAKSAEGRQQQLELLETADVFISNMRGPAMRRLGLDYASLAQKYPRLIYCACYGYSENGPYAGRPAIDDTIQAASGVAWLQGAAGAGALCELGDRGQGGRALRLQRDRLRALCPRAHRQRAGDRGADV